jgi:hypothetical protein
MPTNQEFTADCSAMSANRSDAVQPKVSDLHFYDFAHLRSVPGKLRKFSLKKVLTAAASVSILSLIGSFAYSTKAEAQQQQVACNEYGQCYVSQWVCNYYGSCWQEWYPYNLPSSYSNQGSYNQGSYSRQGSICDTYQPGSTWDYVCNPNSSYRQLNRQLLQPNVW